MLSFIVPAHNEQACLGRTLQAIHASARAAGQPYEIVVADDASTDATAEVAQQNHARVIGVNRRQIAATRNAGGRAAQGERLFFVDADTIINARAVAEALRYMDHGAAGGGGPALFDGMVPLYIRLMAHVGVVVAKLVGFTGGAFMFCTRAAFQAAGGFDERFFWGEEVVFALALKRQGRFIVLWEPVLTSPRRLRTLSAGQLAGLAFRTAFSPFQTFTRRASVEKIWYDSNRASDDAKSNSWAVNASNGVGLLVVLVLFTGPMWNFVPQSLTPWNSPLGKIRLLIGIFLCHVGLIFWPLAAVVFGHLFRRRHWVEWIKLAALAAFCFWLAWDATHGVAWIWGRLFQWLAHFHYAW